MRHFVMLHGPLPKAYHIMGIGVTILGILRNLADPNKTERSVDTNHIFLKQR